MPCGFCFNLSMPFEICESHNVSNCYYLANTRCNYCKNFGHTPKYCMKLVKKQRQTNLSILVSSPPAKQLPLGPRQCVPSYKELEKIQSEVLLHAK